MIKKPILLFLFLFSCGTIFAQISYSVSFSKATVALSVVNSPDAQSYSKVNYLGLSNQDIPGVPDLPRKFINLIIPYNKDVTQITVNSVSWETISLDHKIYPTQRPLLVGSDESSTIFCPPDSLIYNSDSVFPGNFVEIAQSGYFDGFNHIASLVITPFQYYPRANLLKVMTALNITVQCNANWASYILPISRNDKVQDLQDKILEGLVENPEMIPSCQPPKTWVNNPVSSNMSVPAYFYTIVTTENLKGSFDDFVKWKNQKGIPTGVVTIENILAHYTGGDEISTIPIVDAAGNLRQYLKDAWANYGTVFVLLAGDKESIPYRLGWNYTNFDPYYPFAPIPADIYFSEYNGSWNDDGDEYFGEVPPQTPVPGRTPDNPELQTDTYIGRILCQTSEEVKNWTKKVMEYEQNPFNGQYEKLGNVYWSQSDQMQTAETYNCLMQHATPDFFALDHSVIEEKPTGDDIDPIEPTGKRVVDELNTGFGWYFIYNMGAPTVNTIRSSGYNEPNPDNPRRGLMITDSHLPNTFYDEAGNGLDNIANHSSMIITSMAGRNADYENNDNLRCMADVYTSLPAAGGPAFLGLTKLCFYSDAFYYHWDFIELTFRNVPSPLFKGLGLLTSVSKNLTMVTPNMVYCYNLIGDPSMVAWTKVPQQFNNVNISDNSNSITINSGETFCYFCVSSLDGSVYEISNMNLGCNSFSVTTPVRPLLVTITKDNFIPYSVLIGGTVTNDIELDGNIKVFSSLTIPAGRTLTVRPGTKLTFMNNASLEIAGALNISGTLEQPVTLDFINKASGTGIVALGGSSINISRAVIQNADNGIYCSEVPSLLKLRLCSFNNNTFGLQLYNFGQVPYIRDCTFKNNYAAMWLTGGTDFYAGANTFMGNDMGIVAILVPNVRILHNQFYGSASSVSGGISLISSSGYVGSNFVTGHAIGLTVYESALTVTENTFTGNRLYGINCSDGSLLDMCTELYPAYPDAIPSPSQMAVSFGGLNTVTNNGSTEYDPANPWDDGSEIKLDNGSVLLSKGNGCNAIADDRGGFNTNLLISSRQFYHEVIDATHTFWGERGPNSGRFANLYHIITDPSSENCGDPVLETPENAVYISDAVFGVVDTFYSAPADFSQVSEAKMNEKQGKMHLLLGHLDDARSEYNLALVDATDPKVKFDILSKLYMITCLRGGNIPDFDNLKSLFVQYAGSISDTVIMKGLRDLTALCLMKSEKYQEAIDIFRNIMESNPGRPEAAYAEIDKTMTEYLAAMKGTVLPKNGDANVSREKLTGKIAELLNKANIINNPKQTTQKIIPSEYKLEQNYPNPFNPATTIAYSIPKAGKVIIRLYDVLGREVMQLLNENKEPRKYNVELNAVNLASGVYIYEMQCNDFRISKKLTVLK